MATRKRKSPDRRRTKKEKNLLSRLLAGTAAIVARNPKAALGTAIFVVAFSFVSANALWYQPGGHPSPFLATRDAQDPNAIAGYRPARRADPQDVTTFRIERQPSGGTIVHQPGEARPAPQQSSGEPQPAGAPQPAADDIRSIIAGETGADRALVAGVQRELARRGLYDGTDDGLMGPRTEAAILFFEETVGLPQRGDATPELLAALQSQQPRPAADTEAVASPAQSAAQSTAKSAATPLPLPIPRQAPRSDARPNGAAAQPAVRAVAQPARAPAVSRPAERAVMRGDDPVTAAIRAAERDPGMTPPADIPRGNAARSGGNGIQSPQLVLQIQKGLSNIAYTDVEVDGVAGSQTKAAIRRFQRHYRLPETGEPDQLVLNKLKAIGAL
jgi:peptidoglycan hydrolase-like protein with peptidoglycan-binding domain